MLRLVFSFFTRYDSEFSERKELGVIGCETIQEGLEQVKMFYPDCHRVNVTIYGPRNKVLYKARKD